MATYEAPPKSPDGFLWYRINWSDWLEGDSLADSTWVADSDDVSLSLSSYTSTAATVWMSGGSNKESYEIKNVITAADGRIDARTINVPVRNR